MPRAFLRQAVRHWTLTTLGEKLITLGPKVVRHARHVVFQLAEVAVPRELFRAILEGIGRLRLPAAASGEGTNEWNCMRTGEITEAVSLHGVEKRAERHKCQRTVPCAREKQRAIRKSDLQSVEQEENHQKWPTLVAGKSPNGKPRFMKVTPCNILKAALLHENKKIAPFRPSGRLFRCLYPWPAVVCAVLTALTCAAANRTWTGTSGIDNNWMTPGNWQGGVAPSPGDNLIFPGVMSGGNETNHNNYPDGTVFGNISINTARGQDYAIGGNQRRAHQRACGRVNRLCRRGAYVFFDITVSNNQSFTASGGLTLNNTIDTGTGDGAYTLIINNSGSVVINGSLTRIALMTSNT